MMNLRQHLNGKDCCMHSSIKQGLAIALAGVALLASNSVMAADGGATKEDAVAMVKKGVAYVKANPADKAYADISDKANAEFHHQDLYLTVYALDGTVKAHGANNKMIGKNLIDLKDIDGKAFVRERVEMAQKSPTFWQDYKFTNPENKKVEPKSMYCERLNDTVVCGGIYK
jgi:cytochrome c